MGKEPSNYREQLSVRNCTPGESIYPDFCYCWVRTFEVGSARVAETDAIKAHLGITRRTSVYWQKQPEAFWSDHGVVEECDVYWNIAGYVDGQVIKAGGELAEAYRAWMKPTKLSNE